MDDKVYDDNGTLVVEPITLQVGDKRRFKIVEIVDRGPLCGTKWNDDDDHNDHTARSPVPD